MTDSVESVLQKLAEELAKMWPANGCCWADGERIVKDRTGKIMAKLRSALEPMLAELPKFIGSWQYAHMCRDEHIQIGHNDSGDDERCPVCRERDRAEAAEQALREAQAERDRVSDVVSWMGQAQIDLANGRKSVETEIEKLRELLDDSRIWLTHKRYHLCIANDCTRCELLKRYEQALSPSPTPAQEQK